MSAKKNASLVPVDKYTQFETFLAADFQEKKKRISRKQFKEDIDAAKKAYAIYMSSAPKEPANITYDEFLATKKKTVHFDSQKTGNDTQKLVNNPLLAPTPACAYTKTPQPMNKIFVPYAGFASCESPCDAPVFCFDYTNFPILEKKLQ
jgi:hypothetical protein